MNDSYLFFSLISRFVSSGGVCSFHVFRIAASLRAICLNKGYG